MFTSIDLSDLTVPHELSEYIQQFPNFKDLSPNSSSKTQKDVALCNQLSAFTFQQQLDGRFFTENFTETDFKDMMHLAADHEDSGEYLWIWHILSNAIAQSRSNFKSRDEHPVIQEVDADDFVFIPIRPQNKTNKIKIKNNKVARREI